MQLRLTAVLALAFLLSTTAGAQLQRQGGIVAWDLLVGLDGQVYAGTATGIARVTTSGLIPVVTTAQPVEQLEQLPDGTFVFFTGSAVMRAAAGGTPTPIAGVPTGFDAVLTKASDGAVWFGIQSLTPSVGRIDPNGTVTIIPQNVSQGSLAPAQGGAVWSAGAQSIALVTPGGQVTTFPMPENEVIFGIAPAPGGGVYIGAGSFGLLHMSPSGVLTTFVNYPAVRPVVAPDGTIYFMGLAGEYLRLAGNQLTSVTDPFAQALAQCFLGYDVQAMVVTPDGTLWVAQQASPPLILTPVPPPHCLPQDPVRDSAIIRIPVTAFSNHIVASVPSLSTIGLYSLGILLVAFALIRLR